MEMTSFQEPEVPSPAPSRVRPRLLALLLGQLLSLFICGTAVSSEFLQRLHVDLPLLQSLLNYFLLSFLFTPVAVFRLASGGRLWAALRQRGWMYAVAAVVDVEANFAIVKAYQFTSVTSVQLLDCLSIPTVLLLSLLLFGARFRWNHFLGVLLCLVGVAAMLVADHLARGSSFSGSRPLLGDALVVAGAVAYGVSNVLQEWLVRRHGQLEYLACLGLFASLLASAQFLLLERGRAASLPTQIRARPVIGAWLAVFAGCMCALYSCMPAAMRRGSAVMVNLNLLTADVYALLFGLLLFNYRFHWLYFLAYAAIMSGVALYVVREPGQARQRRWTRLVEKLCCRAPAEG